MSVNQFAIIAASARQEERHHRCAVDTNLAQLWIAGKFVSTGRRVSGVTHLTSPSWAIVGASRAACVAYAKGIVADECAIIAGERDPQKLAELRNRQCKKSVEEIGKALTGTWRAEHLFVLKQALELYDFYTKQVESCDVEIERMYALTRPDWAAGELKPLTAKKRKSKSKNAPEQKEEIRQHLKRISGVDLSVVDGFGVSLAQTVIMEVGTDMSKFPSEKHFCSWLGLAPKHEISGGKVLKNKTLKTKNRAGQAFRMAAQSVKGSDCVFGSRYRRLRARLDNRQATVATAHAIARVVYRMLKYQVEYEELSVEEYEQEYKNQQVKYLKKKAEKFGFRLMPA